MTDQARALEAEAKAEALNEARAEMLFHFTSPDDAAAEWLCAEAEWGHIGLAYDLDPGLVRSPLPIVVCL